jgi:hypothetical protein
MGTKGALNMPINASSLNMILRGFSTIGPTQNWDLITFLFVIKNIVFKDMKKNISENENELKKHREILDQSMPYVKTWSIQVPSLSSMLSISFLCLFGYC